MAGSLLLPLLCKHATDDTFRDTLCKSQIDKFAVFSSLPKKKGFLCKKSWPSITFLVSSRARRSSTASRAEALRKTFFSDPAVVALWALTYIVAPPHSGLFLANFVIHFKSIFSQILLSFSPFFMDPDLKTHQICQLQNYGPKRPVCGAF